MGDEDNDRLAKIDIEIANITDAIEGFKKIFASKGKAETAPKPTPAPKKEDAPAPVAKPTPAPKKEDAPAPEESEEEKALKKAFSFAPDEKVVYVGVVKKLHEWTSWIYKTRSLVLTNKRLFYYEPDETEMKGEFILSKDTEVRSQNHKTFVVKTNDKERYMETPDQAKWVDSIQ